MRGTKWLNMPGNICKAPLAQVPLQKSGSMLMPSVRALVLLLVIGQAVACKGKEHEAEAASKRSEKEPGVDVVLSPEAEKGAHLAVTQASLRPRRTSLTVAGLVDFTPSRVARIGPNISGRVAKVSVSPGQRVTKGTVVATLEGIEVGRARADWLAVRSRLELAEVEVAREEKMVSAGASAERNLQTARMEKRVAEAELRAAEGRLATFGVRGSEGPVSSMVPLITPLAGTVLEVKARIGQPVGATDTLVVVGETTEVWLTVDVYERDLGKVHIGDEVTARSIAFPDRSFGGHVDHMDSLVDPDRRALKARIVLPNPDGALRPGMTANALILGAPVVDDAGAPLSVVTVPRGAVQTIDGAPFVFVPKQNGKYEMRAVERGQEAEGAVEILHGLNAGEPIVSEGSFILKSEVLREQMGAND
jgi:cobalt-zinc-cadmium efflux system membrane fusion protein